MQRYQQSVDDSHIHATDEQLVIRRGRHLTNAGELVVREQAFRLVLRVKLNMRLDGIESSSRVVIGLNGNSALAIVDRTLGEGRRVGVNHLDLSVGSGIDVQSLLLRLGDDPLVCVGELLLVGYLGLDDGIFVSIR